MAINKGNQVMHNVRGMFARQVVFKNRLGTPYVAGPPNRKENRIPKPGEVANQNKFGRAVEFGKYVVRDPALKEMYAALVKQGQTAYNVAVSDARIAPKVKSLITQGYNGKIGSCILIQATDNVKVTQVQVTIYDENMTVVEQGEAADNGDNMNWMYAATVHVENSEGYTIGAKACDLAENETTKTSKI